MTLEEYVAKHKEEEKRLKREEEIQKKCIEEK
jgi:hypothetical protein